MYSADQNLNIGFSLAKPYCKCLPAPKIQYGFTKENPMFKFWSPLCNFSVRKTYFGDAKSYKLIRLHFWSAMMRGARSNKNFWIFLIRGGEIMKCSRSVQFFNRQVIRVLQFREATHVITGCALGARVTASRVRVPPAQRSVGRDIGQTVSPVWTMARCWTTTMTAGSPRRPWNHPPAVHTCVRYIGTNPPRGKVSTTLSRSRKLQYYCASSISLAAVLLIF